MIMNLNKKLTKRRAALTVGMKIRYVAPMLVDSQVAACMSSRRAMRATGARFDMWSAQSRQAAAWYLLVMAPRLIYGAYPRAPPRGCRL